MPADDTWRRILLGVMVVLTSCAGSARPAAIPAGDASREAVAPDFLAGLPTLPDDRGVSSSRITQLDGKFAWFYTLNAAENGTALDLVSSPDRQSYGIWRLNPWLESLESVHVVMSVPDGEQAWIALSDYSRDTWQIDGPLTTGKSLLLDDAKHRSPAGNMHLAVITAGGDRATVHMLVLTTEDGWVIVTVDDYGDVGGHTSLAVVDGKPAISYYSYYQSDLKFASSATVTGSNAADWSVLTVDGAGEVGQYTSLAEVEGQPAISYRDYTNHALNYVRRLPFEPYSWTPVTVRTSDLGEEVGLYTSLAVVNGYPLIIHHDAGEGNLLHAVSITPTGMLAADWQNYTTDNGDGGTAGMHNSMAVVDGKAAVSYGVNYTVNSLTYKLFSHPPVYVDLPLGEAKYTSLAVVNGKPAISWYESNAGALNYSFSSTVRGTSSLDWDTILIDVMGSDPVSASMALIDGRPAICYSKQTSTGYAHLRFAWSSTPTGWAAVDWQTTVVDDSSLYTGNFASLAEVDGKPAISYYDNSNACLKYAIRLGP